MVLTGFRCFLNSGETNSQGLKGVWRMVHCEKSKLVKVML